MSKPKSGFVYYESFYNAEMRFLKGKSGEELIKAKAVAYDLHNMICRYGFFGELPGDNTNENDCVDALGIAFDLIKPQIDANMKRYLDGCKGGRPKKDKETTLDDGATDNSNDGDRLARLNAQFPCPIPDDVEP